MLTLGLGGRRPSRCILAAMLALLAVAGCGCSTGSTGQAMSGAEHPRPGPGAAAPPMMTPPDY